MKQSEPLMKKLFIFFICLLTISLVVSAKQTGKWTKILSPKKDVSFLLPKDFLVDNEDGKYRAYAYHNQVTINIEIENTGRAKQRLNQMRQYNGSTDNKITSFAVRDFVGDVYEYNDGEAFSIYIASSKNFYRISASAKDKKNPVFETFLFSIELDGNPLFKQKNIEDTNEMEEIVISSLKTSPIILAALKRDDLPKPKVFYAEDDLDKNKKDTDENKKANEKIYLRPMIILRKPPASYNDHTRNSMAQGTVKLKIVFQGNGQIGKITVLGKIDKGLIESSVNAARKIKFLPAETDGQPVDVTMLVQYSFIIY